jgi:hypothetical protein
MVAGIAREVLFEELVVGQRIPVRAMGPGGRGETNYSAKGLLRLPWERVAEEFRAGDVVRGRVSRVDEGHALVEMLPGAAGYVALSEMDVVVPRSGREALAEGEVVSVRILSLDPVRMRARLSLKQAFGHAAKPRIALVPGGRPFPREAGEPGGPAAAATGAAPCASPEHREAMEAKDRLAEEVRALRAELVEARRDLRSARDRAAALERAGAGDGDPASSEREFLRAVRVAHARMLEEGDRLRHPLRPMRVGREFLGTLRGLEGIPVEKVVEVCAQVACGLAREMPSRKPHRAGQGGSGGAERAADGARAWRCSLQDATPSARRLHWWEIPGDGGGVEFASVGLHDDFRVPE